MNSSAYKLIRNLLSFGRRHRDHPKLNLLPADNFAKAGKVVDRHPLDLLPDDSRIAIKRGHHAKALRGKSLVAQQGPSHVSDADHCDGPLAIGPENSANLGDQLGAPIADPWMPKMAEIREIFSHL